MWPFKVFFLFFLFWGPQQSIFAQELELEKILKNDRLEEKKQQEETKKKEQELKTQELFSKEFLFPNEQDFWAILSQYWSLKNVAILKWNQLVPDLGLGASFKKLLETVGIFQQEFFILTTNSLSVFHAALPFYEKKSFHLLSFPFYHALDLTLEEGALLLFEDFIRHQLGIFKRKIAAQKELLPLYGKSLWKQEEVLSKMPNLVETVLAQYDSFLLEKGFSLEDQQLVAQKMSLLLSGTAYMPFYLSLIQKRVQLIQAFPEYERYSRLFPGLERQYDWANPKKSQSATP